MGPAQLVGHRFLPEVEGLRAVAAVLVAVYHIFLGRVSGGVDVFFLIAGFLVTTSLLGQVAGGGGVQAGRYLGRLMVRLLPVAVMVLAFVIAGTLLWIPETRRASMLGEVVASSLYVENWALAQKAVDYAARGELKSPVQHFWAMSVQGQFYLLWLALVGGVALVFRPRLARRALAVVLVAVIAASLAFSTWLTAANQPFAYFHTGARVWEFAAGGLLAVVIEPVLRILGRLGTAGLVMRGLAGWIGLGLVVSCGLVLTVSTAFPGVAALWPVGGAILVVLAAGGGGRWSVSRVLGSAPFVFTGGVAYALYLWHWPLLVFARLGNPAGIIDPATGAAVLAGSFVLAVVTTRLVERPIRLRLASSPMPWRVTAAGASSLVAVVLVATLASQAVLVASQEQPDDSLAALAQALEDDLAIEPEASPPPNSTLDDGATDGSGLGAGSLGAGSLGAGTLGAGTLGVGQVVPDPSLTAPGGPVATDAASAADPAATSQAAATPAASVAGITNGRSEGPFVPTLAKAAEDRSGLQFEGCQQGSAIAGLLICTRGDPDGTLTVMLIGGSHATHWYPALNVIAKRREWRLLTAVKGSCRVTQAREFIPGDTEDQSCKSWLADLLAWIKANPPDVIVTTGTATSPDREFLPEGYLDVWRMLGRRGIPVIAIRDTPRAPFDRVDCLAMHRENPWRCDIPRSPTLDAVNPLTQREDIPDNVIVVDVNDWICTADTCPAIVGHVVVYRDAHHLTATYMRTLIPMLAAQIPKHPVAVIRRR